MSAAAADGQRVLSTPFIIRLRDHSHKQCVMRYAQSVQSWVLSSYRSILIIHRGHPTTVLNELFGGQSAVMQAQQHSFVRWWLRITNNQRTSVTTMELHDDDTKDQCQFHAPAIALRRRRPFSHWTRQATWLACAMHTDCKLCIATSYILTLPQVTILHQPTFPVHMRQRQRSADVEFFRVLINRAA